MCLSEQCMCALSQITHDAILFVLFLIIQGCLPVNSESSCSLPSVLPGFESWWEKKEEEFAQGLKWKILVKGGIQNGSRDPFQTKVMGHSAY